MRAPSHGGTPAKNFTGFISLFVAWKNSLRRAELSSRKWRCDAMATPAPHRPRNAAERKTLSLWPGQHLRIDEGDHRAGFIGCAAGSAGLHAAFCGVAPGRNCERPLCHREARRD